MQQYKVESVVILDFDYHHGHTQMFLLSSYLRYSHIILQETAARKSGLETRWCSTSASTGGPFDPVAMMSVCRFGKGIYPVGDEGSSDKVGEGAARGKNVNFAFEGPKMMDTDYLPAFSAALLMIKVSQVNMI